MHPTDGGFHETFGTHRKRAVVDINCAAVGCIGKQLIAVGVARRPIKVFRTCFAHENEFLAAFDVDVVGIGHVLKADRVVNRVFTCIGNSADHKTAIGILCAFGNVVQSRRIKHNPGFKDIALIKFGLFFTETMCGIDREVSHKVAQEVLLHFHVFADQTCIGKRVGSRGNQVHRPVVVVPGNHRTVFKRQTVLNRILDVGNSRRGHNIRDDVHFACFRINCVNRRDGCRNFFEELIKRGLDAAAGADRHCRSGAVFRRQVDVIDIKHAAVVDVDDCIDRDGIDLHDDIIGSPIHFIGRRQFAVRADNRGNAVLTDIDGVVTEHARGVAFVIFNERSVEVAAFDVDRRVFKPSFVN